MIDIPAWLKNDINKYHCPKCQKVMSEKNISAIGIKISSRDKEKTAFFFESLCSCQHKTKVELNVMSVEDFVSDMVQEYTEGIEEELTKDIIKDTSSGQNVNKIETVSKISDDEYSEMVNGIKNCEYFDDFLIKLGFSSAEIEQNKKEGVKEYNRKNGCDSV